MKPLEVEGVGVSSALADLERDGYAVVPEVLFCTATRRKSSSFLLLGPGFEPGGRGFDPRARSARARRAAKRHEQSLSACQSI